MVHFSRVGLFVLLYFGPAAYCTSSVSYRNYRVQACTYGARNVYLVFPIVVNYPLVYRQLWPTIQ